MNIHQVKQDFDNGTLIGRATIGKVIEMAMQAAATPAQPIAVSAPPADLWRYGFNHEAFGLMENGPYVMYDQVFKVHGKYVKAPITKEWCLKMAAAEAECDDIGAGVSAIAVSAPTDDLIAFGASLLGCASTTDRLNDKEALAWVRGQWAEWQVARAAAPVSGQGASGLPPPYGWLQYIDGKKTQNFARDAEELAQVKDIFRVMKHTGKAEYPGVYSEDQMLAALAYGQAHGQLCIDSRPRSEDSRAEVLGYAIFRDGVQQGVERTEKLAKHWQGATAIPLVAAPIRALASTTPQKADDE